MTEFDKVQQAEWKLQGLCQLCGSSLINSHLPYYDGDKYVSDCDYNATSWHNIPVGCLDKKLFEHG